MAISEVCKFEVKEEIDRYIKTEGISRNEASKKLATFYTDILGVEVKPETIRQKDYRVRRELATNVTTDGWPKCKDCGSNPVLQNFLSGNPDDSGLCLNCKSKQEYDARPECENESHGRCKHHAKVANGPNGKPAKHGLCKGCRQAELMGEQIRKSKEKTQRAQKEFDEIPLNPQAEQDWTRLAEQLEGLWTLSEEKTGSGSTITTATFNFTIGKVSPEVLERINVAFKLLYDEIEEVRELSQAPAFNT